MYICSSLTSFLSHCLNSGDARAGGAAEATASLLFLASLHLRCVGPVCSVLLRLFPNQARICEAGNEGWAAPQITRTNTKRRNMARGQSLDTVSSDTGCVRKSCGCFAPGSATSAWIFFLEK